LKAAGICGMFSKESDLSSNNPLQRQAALDYIKRELEFGEKVGAEYLLVAPGAVGRPVPCDDMEFETGDMLINLHLADSNRCALGDGFMDVDTIIMALYLIGFNTGDRYVTPEPLGPGGDPYPAMYGRSDKPRLDELVNKTVAYFRQREEELLK
jgi:sugar phosphate isomerase/epimerase